MTSADLLRNPLLARMLRRSFDVRAADDFDALIADVARGAAPACARVAEHLPKLLAVVASSLDQAERELTLKARSLELSSIDLVNANERLLRDSERQRRALIALRATTNELLVARGRPPLDAGGAEDIVAITDLVRQLLAEQEDEEAKLRSLVVNLPGCIYRLRPTKALSVWYVSDGIEALTGWTAEEHRRRGAELQREMVGPDVLAWKHERVGEAVKARRTFEFEYLLRHRDGSARWVIERGQGLFAPDGTLRCVDGVILDNHALKQTQLEVEAARGQLLAAIESLDTGFVMFDGDRRFVVSNAAYARSRDVELPPAGEFDVEVPRGDRWFRVQQSHTADGHTVQLHTDITAARTLTEELRVATESATAASRAKSEFLANMSHEIRTPMNGIVGLTELTLTSRLDADQRENLELIRTSAQNLLVVINDILDFSKIEAGRMEIEQVAVDVPDLVDEMRRTFVHRARELGVTMTARIADGCPDVILGDPTRLRQILTNFLGNAVKFTPPGGRIALDVARVGPADGPPTLRFAVADTGIGIPASKRDRMFDAFSQADNSITRRYGGTGLGLTICRQLVELLGGEIGVESEEGVGSTFHFTVPVVIGSRDADPESECGVAPVVALDVLLAEDHLVNQKLMLKMLGRDGHRVTLARDGEEAVARFEAGRFDVVLMDLQMPKVSGLEAARRIRAFELATGAAPTPIVALTANAMAEARIDCLAAGMDGYVTKPVSARALAAELAKRASWRATSSPPSSGPPFTAPLAPPDEAERAAELASLGLLDTPPEERFDRITRLACQLFGVPIAVVSLVDADRQYFKSAQGLDVRQTPREVSFCGHTILDDAQLVVPDALGDGRFAFNPLVREDPHIRFYCGQPLHGPTGKRVGALCIIDRNPRDGWSAGDRRALADLAGMVERELALGAPAPAPAVDPAVDLGALLDSVGGDAAFAAEVGEAFVADARLRLGRLEDAVARVDAASVSRDAHALKGASGSIFAAELARLAAEQESAARAGDLAGSAERITAIAAQVERVAAVFAALVAPARAAGGLYR